MSARTMCRIKNTQRIFSATRPLLILVLILLSQNFQAELKLCLAEADFPPFTFKVDVANSEYKGYTVELIEYVSTHLERPIVIRKFPWKRCLFLLERGEVDIVADAYHDVQRAKKFYYSRPYYKMTPQFYYDQRVFPDGFPHASGPVSLPEYRGCGIQGYSYEHYGPGYNRLIKSASSLVQLFWQLARKRCDYVVEELEIVEGVNLLGPSIIDLSNIKHARPESARSPELHFIYSKDRAIDAKIIADINVAIQSFINSGQASKVMEKLMRP